MIDLKIESKTRTQPFFGAWIYCAVYWLPEAHVLRKLNHQHIENTIRVRRAWEARSVNFAGSWYRRGAPITADVEQNLHDVCDFMLSDAAPKKLTFSGDYMYVYANDIGLFQRFQRTGLATLIKTVQAHLSGTPGAVILKHPMHKLRTYFREKKVETNKAQSIREFLMHQSDVRISPGLQHWIDSEYSFLASHHFVDHDEMGVILMLNMIEPNIIRKTLSIEAAK